MLAGAVGRLPPYRVSPAYKTTVPVFVAAPPTLVSGVDIIERFLGTITVTAQTPDESSPGEPNLSTPPVIGADRWVVLQDRVAARPVSPFSLPLDVVGVGARGAEALSKLGSPWVKPGEQLQPHLADISWLEEPRDALARLAEQDIDVLIVDAFDGRWLDSMTRRRARSLGAVRVVIVLGVGDGGPLEAVDIHMPTARSVLTVKGPPIDAQFPAVSSFLLALSHDLPLHEALATARNAAAGVRIDLSASPESLHDLRLTSAWAELERDLAELSGSVGPGTAEELIRQGTAGLPAAAQDAVRELVTGVSEARRMMEVDFAMESEGLHPLARARRRLAEAHEAVRKLRALPVARDTPAEQPFRVVNMGLRRQGDILAPGALSNYVDPERSLVAGGRYDLDVQIGAPWLKSLVADDPETAQLHLPDDRRGNDVQVTVFGDDVTVLGERTQVLHVPPVGPSDVVSFGLIMPNAVGSTWLRLSVFHRENLLQTFRLDLLVTDAEERQAEPVLAAHLQHSATRDWTNVARLGPRAVSLTVNADPAGGHRIFIKSRDVAATLPVDIARQDQAASELRRILMDAVDEKVDDAETVWRLAKKGRDLYFWIFERLGEDNDEGLRRLRRSADQAIQIIRADVAQAVPWSLVYDWSLPEVMYGGDRPPVCFGRTDDGRPCAHHAGSKAVCVSGFWGIRHRLEELLPDPSRRDMPEKVAVGNPGVLVADGVQDDASKALQERLPPIVAPGAIRTLSAEDSLLDSLFHVDRPGIVLVLGHYETRYYVDQPEASRIGLLTADGFLWGNAITEQAVERGRWKPPHSVVFLLSCRSMESTLTELTSLFSSLQGVRAGAIIGTECDVYSDLAVDFTLELLGVMTGRAAPSTALIDDDQAPTPKSTQEFAQAVRIARRRIVMDKGNPRGFVFGAFGPAELGLLQA